jgi:peptidoglycan/xylan/chitin deacetylase (PgdA/CDA1 family)
VFLYSDFVASADALTWPQMLEMKKSGLIDIQPHSKSHANLVLRLPQETDGQYRQRIRKEMEIPSDVIERRLGDEVFGFAYPYGDTNDEVVEELQRNGFALGLTVTPGGNGFFADPYMLRRTMIFGDDDIAAFAAKLVVFHKSKTR